MNWLGRTLMALFPPEKEPPGIESEDMKRYHNYLGPNNYLRYNRGMDWMEMRAPGKDTQWKRIPTLEDWLRRHAPERPKDLPKGTAGGIRG